jgi:hypothetical protein
MSESQQVTVSDAEVLEQVTKLELFYKGRGENSHKSYTELYDEAEALLLKRKSKLHIVNNTRLSSSSTSSLPPLPPLPSSPRSILDNDDDDDDDTDMKLGLQHANAVLASSLSESSSSSKLSSNAHINIIKNDRGNVTFHQSVSVIHSLYHSYSFFHSFIHSFIHSFTSHALPSIDTHTHVRSLSARPSCHTPSLIVTTLLDLYMCMYVLICLFVYV